MGFKTFLENKQLPEQGETIAFEDAITIGKHTIDPNTEFEIKSSDGTQIGITYKNKTGYFTAQELKSLGYYLV